LANQPGSEMNPLVFCQTIYLGDRWCKQLIIDGVAREIRLQIDLISRVRGTQWDFYAAEDIPDGFLVLEEVARFELFPQGPLPNDWIELVSVSETAEDGSYRFEFSLGSSSAETAQVVEVILIVIAKQLCLADAKGNKIRV
jgi:hypothetical protein